MTQAAHDGAADVDGASKPAPPLCAPSTEGSGGTRCLQAKRQELGAGNWVVAHGLGRLESEGLVEMLCGDELGQDIQAHDGVTLTLGLTDHVLDKLATDVAASDARTNIHPLELTGGTVHSAKRSTAYYCALLPSKKNAPLWFCVFARQVRELPLVVLEVEAHRRAGDVLTKDGGDLMDVAGKSSAKNGDHGVGQRERMRRRGFCAAV